MNDLNLFIYLDREKLHSLSSQIFKGVIESVISEKKQEGEDHETQKGPIASGRLLSDILRTGESTKESKLLYDYLYVQFEAFLHENEQIYELSPGKRVDRKEIGKLPFIKVSGPAKLIDPKTVQRSLGEFNQLGEAITYITGNEERKQIEAELQAILDEQKDRNKKALLRARLKQLTSAKELAKKTGLHQDPKFLEHLIYTLNFGFEDFFEIRIQHEAQDAEEAVFSSTLKREAFTEDEKLIVRKYARTTEVPLTIVGVPTQWSEEEVSQDEDVDVDTSEKTNMKEGLYGMVEAYEVMEQQFFGKAHNEIFIDPIAIYRRF